MAAPLPKALRKEAKTLYLTGLNCKEVAAVLNLKPITVQYWRRTEEWENDRKQVKSVALATVKGATGNGLQRRSSEARELAANAVDAQLRAIAANPGVDDLANSKEGQGSAAVLKTIVETAAQVYGWNDEKTVGLVVVDDLRVFDQKKEKAVDVIEVKTAE